MMVECILLISSILFCSVSVYRARINTRQAIWQRMLDIANCAAGSVNGDILKTLKEEDVGTDKYKDLYDRLAVFRDNVELEYVYSIKKIGDKDYIFTMDLDQVDPASYGESVKFTEALDKAGSGAAAVDEVPYKDAWGEFYSAYSPVFDSSGNVAGIIAVDFSADWFDAQLSEQTRSNLISHGTILILSLLVGAVLSLLIVRPFVLYQGKLLEEKVLAESANHAKSEFLANMSHEIRTPINAMLGMNEMIINEDKRAQENIDGDVTIARDSLDNINSYAANVKKAGDNLLAIVSDILDFSKIEDGNLEITEAPYKLSSLLRGLNDMIRFKAQDKGLDFDINVERSIPENLYGDVVRIRQVLGNILGNAVKYTEKGSVKMSVTGDPQDDGRYMLTVVVRDTGIGIRSEDLPKLFTGFERLEMEKNSTLEGTGLGLVITKRLLDAMDGTISVESEYQKGSAFTVSIPQKILSVTPIGDFKASDESTIKRNEGLYESQTVEPAPVANKPLRAPSARILVVDDTKTNLVVLVHLLKKTMIRMDTASSGAESVAKAADTKYDLIFMDQRMPEMEGSEALHKIRATQGGASSDSPIVCLTADAVIGAREHYLAEGFSDYMAKPVDYESLEKMILKFLPAEKIESA